MLRERTSLEGRNNGHSNNPLTSNQTIDLLLTAQEAARILPLHPVTILRWAREGKIPHRRLGRKVVFPLSKLNDWLASGYTVAVGHAA